LELIDDNIDFIQFVDFPIYLWVAIGQQKKPGFETGLQHYYGGKWITRRIDGI
jgi:hypothetical protein